MSPVEEWRTSVLMSVYHRAVPEHVDRALASIFAQTLPPDEVVVVEDGPLGEGILHVLDSYENRDIPLVRLRLPENVGLAGALQAGVEVCHQPWIVRMDADDVAVPYRLAEQMRVVRGGGVDVVGSAMAEFEGDETHLIGIRSLPLDHRAIARYARMNNPVNHPTAVIRRSALRDVGGYVGVHLMEDYDLFARLLAHGCRFTNVAEPLLLFRGGDEMLRRRASSGMFRAEVQLQMRLHSYGIVSAPRALFNVGARTLFRALPHSLMKRAYGRLFYRGASR